MNDQEQVYLDLLAHVMAHGVERGDRTGTGTRSIFGAQLRFDLRRGFPLITTKRVFFKGIAVELLWLLKGDTNTRFLKEHGVGIWDQWATEDGDLGPIYGAQWRTWRTPDGNVIDQIAEVVQQIRERPESRRHLVTAWNPAVLPDERIGPQQNVEAGHAALASCHAMFQFYVAGGRLSCALFQRSSDLAVGGPFNIAQYSLLTHLIADQCDLGVADFIWMIGDAHIYLNQFGAVKEQLSRQPTHFPTLRLRRKPDTVFDYSLNDFVLEGYNPAASIKIPVAV
jgi:thymidylate synthase